MQSNEFLPSVVEAEIPSQVYKQKASSVRIGFEFEICIPGTVLQADAMPRYDSNDNSWINGKTLADLFQRDEASLSTIIGKIFRIKPSKTDQYGGTDSIWSLYANWASENAYSRENIIETLAKIKEFLDKLKADRDVKTAEKKEKISFFLSTIQSATGLKLTDLMAGRNLSKIDDPKSTFQSIEYAARQAWIHTTGAHDQHWYNIKNVADPHKMFLHSGAVSEGRFVSWCQSTFGTTDLAELLKKWWTIRRVMVDFDHYRKFPAKQMVWYYVTPNAVLRSSNEVEVYDSRVNEWLKAQMEPLFGKTTIFTRYHQSRKSLDQWYIEPDGSLQPKQGDHAAEVVGPPQSPVEAIQTLKKFVTLCKENGIYANSSTGLHINVSIPDSIDVLKLSVFSGDKWVLEKFGRLNSRYARSIIDNIKSQVQNRVSPGEGITKDQQNDLLSSARNIASDHFSSINLTSSGYISFRQVGGDYLTNIGDAMIALKNFIRAMIIASDPDAYKDEYLAKLIKIAGYSEPNTAKPSPRQSMGGSIYAMVYKIGLFSQMNNALVANSTLSNSGPAAQLPGVSTDRPLFGFQPDPSIRNTFLSNSISTIRASTTQLITDAPDEAFLSVTIYPANSDQNQWIGVNIDNYTDSIFGLYDNRSSRIGIAYVEKVIVQPGTADYNKVKRNMIAGSVIGPRAALPESAILRGMFGQ